MLMPFFSPVTAADPYNGAFVFTVATTTPSETFTVPCQNVGTFNATIDWGDASADSTITAYNDADLAHIYATADTYTITITGTFPNIFFNNGGNKREIKSILNFGTVGWLTFQDSFIGCTNITSVTSTSLDFSSVTSLRQMFRGCTGITSLDVTGWDLSSCTSLYGAFRACTGLSTLDVSGWDVSGVDNFGYVFADNPNLTTLDVSNWDTSLLGYSANTFSGCSSLTGLDISGWSIGAVTNLTNFLLGCDALSTAVYDATLIAWEGQTEPSGITAHFGSAQYTSGGAAETARTTLTTTSSWTITDGGPA